MSTMMFLEKSLDDMNIEEKQWSETELLCAEDPSSMGEAEMMGIVGLVLEIEEPVMTSKMMAFLVDAEACLYLAAFVTLPSIDNTKKEETVRRRKRPPPPTEVLQLSFRAARLLSETLLPHLGSVATKLTSRLLEAFDENSGGWWHHGCRVLEALFEAYPDAVYEGVSSKDMERLVGLADVDGNCADLFLELCAPFQGGSGHPDEDEEDEECYQQQRRMPTPRARWRFVSMLSERQITKLSADLCPRTFPELVGRLDRDPNGELLLQPLAFADVDKSFIRALLVEGDDYASWEQRVDAARGLLAAATLGSNVTSSGGQEESKESGENKESGEGKESGSALVSAVFRRKLAEAHLEELRRAVTAAKGQLRCLLLEVLVVCLARDRSLNSQKRRLLPTDFCLELCDAFAESKGCFDALFFELVSWALKSDQLPAAAQRLVMQKVLEVALTNDAKPHAVALCAVARLAKPHLATHLGHRFDDVSPKIRRQARLRFFRKYTAEPLEGSLEEMKSTEDDIDASYASDLGFPRRESRASPRRISLRVHDKSLFRSQQDDKDARQNLAADKKHA